MHWIFAVLIGFFIVGTNTALKRLAFLNRGDATRGEAFFLAVGELLLGILLFSINRYIGGFSLSLFGITGVMLGGTLLFHGAFAALRKKRSLEQAFSFAVRLALPCFFLGCALAQGALGLFLLYAFREGR